MEKLSARDFCADQQKKQKKQWSFFIYSQESDGDNVPTFTSFGFLWVGVVSAYKQANQELMQKRSRALRAALMAWLQRMQNTKTLKILTEH